MTLNQKGLYFQRDLKLRLILFLDFDDVIFRDKKFNSVQVMFCFRGGDLNWPELWANVIDQNAAEMLRSLDEEFDPLYVISSSWASFIIREQMAELFRRTHFEFVLDNLHEEWNTYQSPTNCDGKCGQALRKSRRQQIEAWLSQFRAPSQSFVVIDDTFSGESLIDSKISSEGHVVLCQVKIGFDFEKLNEARQSLISQHGNVG